MLFFLLKIALSLQNTYLVVCGPILGLCLALPTGPSDTCGVTSQLSVTLSLSEVTVVSLSFFILGLRQQSQVFALLLLYRLSSRTILVSVHLSFTFGTDSAVKVNQ